MCPKKIGGVMVLYNPDWSVTDRVIESFSSQVDILCIVDNTNGVDNSNHLVRYDNIKYINNGSNLGIATAQNKGIQELIDSQCDYVVFSDQDSYAPEDVVNKLYDGFIRLEKKGIRVGVVGTRAINKQTSLPYPAKSKELGVPAEFASGEADDLTECYSVISSISMISTISLMICGGFDEALFIDGVDHEWCWRAYHKLGLRSFIVETATIFHMLGEGDRQLGGRNIAISSVFRVYYQFRNFFWLKKRSYVPSWWIKKNIVKFAVKAIYFPIMVTPRIKYLLSILQGIRDGIYSKQSHSKWPNFQQKKD